MEEKQIICQVLRPFGVYNAGERISGSQAQVNRWLERKAVAVVPDPVPKKEPEEKAVAAPPVDKMVAVADVAKADDDLTQPARRGPGRPARG